MWDNVAHHSYISRITVEHVFMLQTYERRMKENGHCYSVCMLACHDPMHRNVPVLLWAYIYVSNIGWDLIVDKDYSNKQL